MDQWVTISIVIYSAGAGLLGRGPSEPLMGQRNQDMGYMNERQSGNFMEQQGRGSLGAEQSRFSAQSLNQQDRPMMQQANEMRGSNRPLMQQTNEMRGNNRPLMQPTNEMRGNNLMQQQQQSMMQQQQQRMQQGMMGKGDGLLGEAPSSSLMGQPAGNLNAARGGNIPSLFDLPSGRGVVKRPGDRMNRGMDNKKPRQAVSLL